MTNREYKKLIWTNEMTTRFWDWQSQYPDLYFTNLFGAEIAQTCKPFLSSEKNILDFGCGVGYLIPHLAKHANIVYGTDLSQKSIKHTNDHNHSIENFKGAYLLKDLLGEKKTFNVVTCIEVLEHLYDDHLLSVVQNIHSLLDHDGIAIFTTPNDEDLSNNMIMCPTSGTLFHRWQHVRSWNNETLPNYLKENGFDVLQIIETDMTQHGKLTLKTMIKKILRLALSPAQQKPPHLICIAAHSK